MLYFSKFRARACRGGFPRGAGKFLAGAKQNPVQKKQVHLRSSNSIKFSVYSEKELLWSAVQSKR